MPQCRLHVRRLSATAVIPTRRLCSRPSRCTKAALLDSGRNGIQSRWLTLCCVSNHTRPQWHPDGECMHFPYPCVRPSDGNVAPPRTQSTAMQCSASWRNRWARPQTPHMETVFVLCPVPRVPPPIRCTAYTVQTQTPIHGTPRGCAVNGGIMGALLLPLHALPRVGEAMQAHPMSTPRRTAGYGVPPCRGRACTTVPTHPFIPCTGVGSYHARIERSLRRWDRPMPGDRRATRQ